MPFRSVDIAVVAVFSALWAALNLTLGPLGFSLLRLPILCDLSVYFPTLLATWLSSKIGVPTVVNLIGSLVVFVMRPGSTHLLGFIASAIVFDALMVLCRHNISFKPRCLSVTIAATAISAYLAGVLIGVIFMGRSVDWALTFWGGWHLIGGIMGMVVALLIIGVLERAGLGRMRIAQR
ncbi:MAG: hypothetical protein QXJ19_01645 [Candidatus Bathyarchaeia archaeon]|nr:hypothetical protein [Candidatus Bathyarchaeota archaeon]